MRVLITGGAGFLGSHLANRLVELGHHVRVIDDLSAGDQSRLDERVHFTRGDVRDIPRLWTVLRDVDCVYHLAARVSVPESVLYPVEYNAVNVGGTVSLMTAARDAQVKRVVLASSGTVYGEQAQQPIPETVAPRPDNPYAVSKLASEYYVLAIGSRCNIETVILRIFNAYGPHQAVPPSHPPVIPQFVKQALSGGSVVVFGNGEQSRDFVYVNDVVSAMVAAAMVRNLNGAIINLGSGRELSINALVTAVARATGKEIRPLYSTAQSGGISRSVADISLASAKLGFTPQVSLEEGLARMVEYYSKLGSRG